MVSFYQIQARSASGGIFQWGPFDEEKDIVNECLALIRFGMENSRMRIKPRIRAGFQLWMFGLKNDRRG
jgi:hypothetical protein